MTTPTTQQPSTRVRIMHFLASRTEPATAEDIRRALDISYPSAVQQMHKLDVQQLVRSDIGTRVHVSPAGRSWDQRVTTWTATAKGRAEVATW